MSLLGIVQDASVRCGWDHVPTSAIGNAGPDALNIQQLVAFAQDTGRDCMERANWVNLDRAATITGDGTTTLWTLPTDWKRFSPSDKSPHGALVSSKYPLIPLYGPINTEDLNLLKALPASTIRPVWRIIGGSLEIWPALSAAELVTFNYYSKNWIMDLTGTIRKTRWSLDTDTSLIEEDVVMKGSVWKWLASKGLDYAEQFRIYEMAFARNAAQQMTERVIATSRQDFYDAAGGFYGVITDLTSH